MKKLLMIALIAMFATVACKKETPPPPTPPVILPDVTITSPKWTDILPEKTYSFTATLSAPALDDVTIKVSNDNSNILTVAAEEIKIVKGETVGSVAFTTKDNAGPAKITFTSWDANVKTPELTINVPIVDPPLDYELPEFENGTFSAISKIVIGEKTVESSAANSPDGANKPLAGHDDFSIGAISDDKKDAIISLTNGIPYTIYYDNFTADNGIEMAVALYIDWNGDLDFSDPREEIMVEKGIPANAKKEISGTITIPAGAVKSSVIRVICYAVEDSNIVGGIGYAKSGYLMDLLSENK